MMDPLTALRLQAEWGADEALADAPVDRFAPVAVPAPPGQAVRAISPAQILSPRKKVTHAGSLGDLHVELQAFEGCALRTTATHTVLPDGNPAAALVVIGDAPGSDDDRSGRAFSGETGALLDRVLGSIGLDRTQMLLTSVVPWRPPGNRPLAEPEIQACLPFLYRLLALTRPQRLLLLGAIPVRALTASNDSLRRLRGRWLDVAVPEIGTTVPALALPPPDQWLRSAASKCELWSDLIQLRIATTPR